MTSVVKLASVLLVILALAALQFAVPAFQPAPQAQSGVVGSPAADAIVLPANTGSWQVANYLDAERGSLFISNPQQDAAAGMRLSPSLNTDVSINVTGVIARTRLTQTFSNDSDQWVDALYVFPLPENAALDQLQMRIGERVIEGQIKEKQQAEKIYQQARQAGKKASLVSQQRPNLFTNAIANIGPGERIAITLEYQQLLQLDAEQYSLRFPMTITPRYMPPGSQTATNDVPAYYSPPAELSEEICIAVNLHAGVALKNIVSEFHPIVTEQLATGHYQLKLHGQHLANQDFVLSWQPQLSKQPQVAHFQQQLGEQQYGLLQIYPPLDSAEQQANLPVAREVIFVLDTSGSMSGDSLAQAKRSLLLALSQLHSDDWFNVIEFNSQAQALWPRAQPAQLSAITAARHFIVKLEANGGTEMAQALQLALAQAGAADSQRLRQVVFITDGSVGNEEALMQLIKSQLHDSRLFTVGIGSAPNSYFMTEAAKTGKGTYTYIGAIEQVEQKILKLLDKLAHPALTDIQLLNQQQMGFSPSELEYYPNVIADLYKGEPLVLSYRRKTHANEDLPEMHLQASYRGQPWQSPIEASKAAEQSGINVLWAREKISQLSRDQRSAMRDHMPEAQLDYYRQQITRTALDHHLVSAYTSLVAVDISPSKPAQLSASQQQVANRLPKGSRLSPLAQLPATATHAPLQLLLGVLLTGVALCLRYFYRRNARCGN